MPGKALGVVYVPRDLTPRGDHRLSAGVAVQDAPGGHGDALAVTRADVGVQTLGPPERIDGKSWVEIEHTDRRITIRGFVPTEAVEDFNIGLGKYTTSVSGPANVPHVILPADTCLFAARGGELVGKVVEDTDELGGASDPPWWHATLLSRWGLIEAWMRDEGPGEDAGARAGDRVAPRFARCE